MALIPSKDTRRLINHYNPLSRELSILIYNKYNEGKISRDRYYEIMLNSVSKMFAKLISKNMRKYEMNVPWAEYEDIFNLMVSALLGSLLKYDPYISNITTFAYNNIMPLIKNPQRYFDKFGSIHSVDQTDRPYGDGAKRGDFIEDPDADVQGSLKDSKLKKDLRRAINKLPKQEREWVEHLYGFANYRKDYIDLYGNITPASIARAEGKTSISYKLVKKILPFLRDQLQLSKIRRLKSIIFE